MKNQNEQLMKVIKNIEAINPLSNYPGIIQAVEASNNLRQLFIDTGVMEFQEKLQSIIAPIRPIIDPVHLKALQMPVITQSAILDLQNRFTNVLDSFDNLNFEDLDLKEETDITLEDLNYTSLIEEEIKPQDKKIKLNIKNVLAIMVAVFQFISPIDMYNLYQQSIQEKESQQQMQEMIENQERIIEAIEDLRLMTEELQKHNCKNEQCYSSSSLCNKL